MDLDYLTIRMGLRDGLSILLEPLQVKLDCFADKPKRFVSALARGHTPRQIGDIGSPTRGTFLYNDGVTHETLLILQSGLLEHIIQGTRRHINVGLARNCDGSRL
jgi:hypothetical protein